MKFHGVFCAVLLLYSSTIGSILFGPVILFMYFKPAIGRKVLDHLTLWWQIYAVVSIV